MRAKMALDRGCRPAPEPVPWLLEAHVCLDHQYARESHEGLALPFAENLIGWNHRQRGSLQSVQPVFRSVSGRDRRGPV